MSVSPTRSVATSLAREALIKSHMRDRSAFVPCILAQFRNGPPRSAQKHSGPSEEALIDRVAPSAASAALRALPRYLPWQQRDALHPSAPDATRVARPNQCFLKSGSAAAPA